MSQDGLQTLQGFRGKLLILEKRRLDLDAARRDYNRLEQKRVKKSENNLEPPAELIIQIQAKETALNGKVPSSSSQHELASG